MLKDVFASHLYYPNTCSKTSLSTPYNLPILLIPVVSLNKLKWILNETSLIRQLR